MPAVFVTGTDTDVGKTFVSALLCKAWGASYWKPVQTGLDSDPGDTKTVKELVGKDLITFKPQVELQKPLAPWRACVLEGEPFLKLEDFKLPKTNDPLIVEGAGGVFVPLTKELITKDLVKQIDCPVIVVARSQLGTLNHTLLTLEHLRAHDVKILGVILNGKIDEDNCTALKELGVKVICQIPLASSVDEVTHLVPSLTELINDYN
ncbi:Dethiobiotin synthetase [Cyberlindnera fabianii]|uniref:Dethiobiotin synthetase n=1 Tax=Cyberlindnera fabianii TaxID=36022 RepID=A0A1V2L3V1_CYBFA|nr:Dethiobiotin synthetase [Cyberlindnera fabianii]